MSPTIVEFSPEYKRPFYTINQAWIEKYYTLEEEDKRLLAHPETDIIAKGGMIFFLLDGEEVAGTCGVMKLDDDTYELVRMSVDERFRGKGYGAALVKHANQWAMKQGAKQVILETGSLLKTAINLYEKLGFRHYLPNAKHRSGLARANVFMRLKF